MNRSIAVFDFDKTLTHKDTLFGFYKSVAGHERLFMFKRLLLLIAGIIYKTGIIDNDTLKRVGIFLFIKGRTEDNLETIAKEYAEQIEMNEIYYKHYKNIEGEIWVVSASPEIYLKYVFPNTQIAGTKLKCRDGKVVGLAINMFGLEKKKYLNKNGINQIGEFYTDSLSDKPLMDIAQKVYLVDGGSLSVLKDKDLIET